MSDGTIAGLSEGVCTVNIIYGEKCKAVEITVSSAVDTPTAETRIVISACDGTTDIYVGAGKTLKL